MNPLLKRLYNYKKIEIFVDDTDHNTNEPNDHRFKEYSSHIVSEVVFNYYQHYFKNKSRVNIDRLVDSIPKTVITGQNFSGPDLSYVISGDKSNKIPPSDISQYSLLIMCEPFNKYYVRSELKPFIEQRIDTPEFQDLLLVSIRSLGNYHRGSFTMFKQIYTQKLVSSLGEVKDTPHLVCKSKEDSFSIPYGPFPLKTDWDKYGL